MSRSLSATQDAHLISSSVSSKNNVPIPDPLLRLANVGLMFQLTQMFSETLGHCVLFLCFKSNVDTIIF